MTIGDSTRDAEAVYDLWAPEGHNSYATRDGLEHDHVGATADRPRIANSASPSATR